MADVCRHGRPYNVTCDFCRVESKNRDIDLARRENLPGRRPINPEPFRCQDCGYTTAWQDTYRQHLEQHTAASVIVEELDTAFRTRDAKELLRPKPPSNPPAKPKKSKARSPNQVKSPSPPPAKQNRTCNSTQAPTSVPRDAKELLRPKPPSNPPAKPKKSKARSPNQVKSPSPPPAKQNRTCNSTQAPTSVPRDAKELLRPKPPSNPPAKPKKSKARSPNQVKSPSPPPAKQNRTCNSTQAPTSVPRDAKELLRPKPPSNPPAKPKKSKARSPNQVKSPSPPPAKQNRTRNSTQAPTSVPRDQVTEWRTYLLDLVNHSRLSAGRTAVALGNNKAAQKHAEAMLEHGFSGHWGMDGLTPAMRYTLAGGTHRIRENVCGVKGIRVQD